MIEPTLPGERMPPYLCMPPAVCARNTGKNKQWKKGRKKVDTHSFKWEKIPRLVKLICKSPEGMAHVGTLDALVLLIC